jgi:hypothetical protein
VDYFEEVEGANTAGNFPDVSDIFHAAVGSVGTASEFVSGKEG